MHPDRLCACSKRFISTQNSTYVVGSVPCCTYDCLKREEARQTRNMRRVPFADEDDQVADPYGKSTYARFKDI